MPQPPATSRLAARPGPVALECDRRRVWPRCAVAEERPRCTRERLRCAGKLRSRFCDGMDAASLASFAGLVSAAVCPDLGGAVAGLFRRPFVSQLELAGVYDARAS